MPDHLWPFPPLFTLEGGLFSLVLFGVAWAALAGAMKPPAERGSALRSKALRGNALLVLGLFLLLSVFRVLFNDVLCTFTSTPCPSASLQAETPPQKPLSHHFALQRAESPLVASRILEGWVRFIEGEPSFTGGRAAAVTVLAARYEGFLTGIDLFFPLVYAVLGCLLLRLGYRLNGVSHALPLALPFAAAVTDFLENAAHLEMMRQARLAGSIAALDAALVRRGYLFSTVKWVLLALTGMVFLGLLYRFLLERGIPALLRRFGGQEFRRPALVLLFVFVTATFLYGRWMLAEARRGYGGAPSPLAAEADGCQGHLNMEFSPNPRDIAGCWVRALKAETGSPLEAAASWYTRFLMRDTVWAVFLYPFALVSLLYFLGETGRRKAPPWAAALPLGVGWADVMENLLHADMLRGAAITGNLAAISGHLVRMSFGFTALKWGVPLLVLAVAVWQVDGLLRAS